MAGEAEPRATSDVLLAALEELRTAEEAKRELAPDDERFAELAARVNHLARTVLDEAQTQRAHAESHRASPTPLVDIPPDAPMAAILERWRAAERRLGSAVAGSEEALSAAAEADACREAYRRAWEAKTASEPDA